MPKTIALDAMGGDHGPKVVVPAAAEVLLRYPNVHLILVGQETILQEAVKQHIKVGCERVTIQNANEVVAMDESPAIAMRQKKNSSMRVALDLVKEQRALACVSAGNTGALMATARLVLKTLPGIDRPAIITGFPSYNGKETRMLDLGANVDSTPENLYQFAVMGSILTRAVENISRPRIALLNIGTEDNKGNELVKKAAELLAASQTLNYIGFIEADKIFEDFADVVVCDGFIGNIALKSMEGVLRLLANLAREELMRNAFTKALAIPVRPLLKRVVKRVDPERHNGAVFIGLDGIVVKSHGSASIYAFSCAIEEAVVETEKNIPQLIKQQVASILQSKG